MSDDSSYVLSSTYVTSYGMLGHIHLNRPQALNVLNHAMIQQLTDILKEWSHNTDIAGVCITGEGRAFCAGGDIKALYNNGPNNIDRSMAFFKDEYALNQLIHEYPKPYIAICQGITMGGGVGISVPGKYRIGCTDLQLAMPETSIGLFPDVGALYYLTRLPNNRGLYLALTGEAMDSNTAYSLGLINYVINNETRESLLNTLCDLQEFDAKTLDAFFHSIQEPTQTPQEEIHTLTGKSIGKIIGNLEMEGCEWAQSTIQTLKSKSPHALLITLSAYFKAQNANFQTVLNQNLSDAKRCLEHPDLYEGIRALLIDKDNRPQWT